MLAKLILYPDHSTQEGHLETSPFVPPNGILNWQLVANNLTTGKIIDLLVCLDELGFLRVEADSGRLA